MVAWPCEMYMTNQNPDFSCSFEQPYTVDAERFTGLNICSFNPIEVFAGNTFPLPWPAMLII